MAGPIERETFIDSEPRATACGSRFLGTSSGAVTLSAGAPSTRQCRGRRSGSTGSKDRADRWRPGTPAWPTQIAIHIWVASKYRRRSTVSVSAPAINANSTIGNEAADCTRDTITGEEDRSVITQPEATPLIQVPILEPSVASQKARNTGTFRGAQALARGAGEAVFSFGSVTRHRSRQRSAMMPRFVAARVLAFPGARIKALPLVCPESTALGFREYTIRRGWARPRF